MSLYVCICEVDHDMAPSSQWCDECQDRALRCKNCGRDYVCVMTVECPHCGAAAPYLARVAAIYDD